MDLVNYIIIVLTHLFAADDIVSSLIIAAAIVVDFIYVSCTFARAYFGRLHGIEDESNGCATVRA